MTGPEAIAAYLANCTARGLRPNSTESYRSCLARLQRDHDGAVQGLDFRTIESWLDGLGVSASTRARYLAFLAGFYRWAVRHDVIVGNPIDKIDRPRQRRRLPRPISEADLTRALDHADPRMRAWLTLAAYQGLRIQEIAGLDADDLLLHLDPPLLRVSKGKGAEERMLPLNPVTEKALRDWGIPHTGCLFPNRYGRPVRVGLTSPRGTMRERTPGVWELRAYTGKDPVAKVSRQRSLTIRGDRSAAKRELAELVAEADSVRIVAGAERGSWRGSEPMRPHTVGQMFRTYLRSLGIHATPHQFRHYFASEVYDVTRDLRLTQELLGHASPHTTAIYTKVRPSHDAVAVVRSLGGASQ